MRPLRLNLFTAGDCADIHTWSSLPYYFYNALLAHHVEVNAVDFSPSAGIIYDVISRLASVQARVRHSLFRSRPDDDFHTRRYRVLANRKIEAATQRWHNVDVNVFLTFSLTSRKWSNVPVVHYCDRTYEQYLEEVGRAPTRGDRRFMEIDRLNIEQADLVLATCPLCCDFIRTRYHAKRVVYLKGGINADVPALDVDTLAAEKESSRDILFVGRGAYRRGADILIRAFKIFNTRHQESFTLHMVGVKPDELPPDVLTSCGQVRFYSYLDRTKAAERAVYERLMRRARLFVVPMRPGPLPNVIQEAHYYCTPVIISNVSNASDYVRHGYNGIVANGLEPETFASNMDWLVDDHEQWRQMAVGAHASVADHSWSNTIRNFLEILRTNGIVKHSFENSIH